MTAEPLDAGELTAWLRAIRSTLVDGADADVPCDGCTACCRSSQFLHIAPDEIDALRHVPPRLRAPAPGLPDGHVVVGFDEAGRCPMLTDSGCSIYADRPRTCRTYDCRVFAATEREPDRPLVRDRVRRWRFDRPVPDDEIVELLSLLRATSSAC
ncbi:MAG: YkgJ family cysteine cluster protein [Actinomycetota bacterium]